MPNFNTGMTQTQLMNALNGGLNAASSENLLAEQAARQHEDDIITAAVAEIINSSMHKNLLELTGTNVTGRGISCTFDATAGTITLDGINQDKKCTGDFNVQVADPVNMDLVEGELYHFACAGTSDTTLGIYIYKSGATPQVQFDTYNNTNCAWNPAWETSNGFRLFIRQGTVVDNVVLRPMICKKAYWDLTETFVPYQA